MIEIPGYTIEKQLGRGGMARVYLARHIGLDRLVAIKVLSKDLNGDKSFSERFMREARIVAKLNHQNIITVFDVGVHNEHHYIAMEYLPGETLDDKVKKKLEIKQILVIIKQIAAALDFAHKKGIVHRDVKPDNILFREDGTAVLTDFGIARSAKSETKMTATGTVIGTPHYMSPEQAQGLEIGPWSDLYSLGIVMFEMFNGKVPFDADSTIAVVFKHITEPVPDLDEKYKQYQPLVNTLLAKEPAERYQTGREVIADIECLDRGDTPANATLIFNQTAINPAASSNTETTAAKSARPVDSDTGSKGKLFAGIAAAVLIISAGATVLITAQDRQLPADRQQAINAVDNKKQELETRQHELEKLTAENTRLQQQRIETEKQQLEKLRQEAVLRQQNEKIARKKQAKAEAEARRVKQELLALKKRSTQNKEQSKVTTGSRILAATQSSARTGAASAEQAKPVAQKRPATAPSVSNEQENRTGLLAGWLGDTDDTTREYINDLLKAADVALENNSYVSARQNYQHVLKKEPGNLHALQGLKNIEQQESANKSAGINDAYTQDLLHAAENALKTDRLSSASYNFQKVLQQVPENEQAISGLNAVFNRHLQLALEEAKDDDFDDAAEHFVAAEKLRPNDKKLIKVSREIAQLRKK